MHIPSVSYCTQAFIKNTELWAGGMAQVLEHLLSKHEALHWSSSTVKKTVKRYNSWLQKFQKQKSMYKNKPNENIPTQKKIPKQNRKLSIIESRRF
jgi:hypothetical protein